MTGDFLFSSHSSFSPLCPLCSPTSNQRRCHLRSLAVHPELPGCTATGATYEAALASIQEAIHRWVETTRCAGHELPPREKRPLEEEREQFVARATSEGW